MPTPPTSHYAPDRLAQTRPLIRQEGGVWKPTKAWLDESDILVRFATPSVLDGSLYGWGWRAVGTTDGLLDAFARIKTATAVEQFASRWGPLWLCKTHHSDSLGSHCLVYQRPQRTLGWQWLYPADCAWEPAEPISAWLREARRVRGTLAIIHSLRKDPPEPASQEAWVDFGLNEVAAGEVSSDKHLFEARFQLHSLVNSYLLSDPGGPRLALQEDMQLRFDLGLGALRAAWLLLAQAAAQQRAIYLCTGCGAFYVRHFDLRRPRHGQANYCDECRGQGRYHVAKRLSKARRRTAIA